MGDRFGRHRSGSALLEQSRPPRRSLLSRERSCSSCTRTTLHSRTRSAGCSPRAMIGRSRAPARGAGPDAGGLVSRGVGGRRGGVVRFRYSNCRALRGGGGLLRPVRVGLAAVRGVMRPLAPVPGLGIPSKYGLRKQWVIGLVDPDPAWPFSTNPAHRGDHCSRESRVNRAVPDQLRTRARAWLVARGHRSSDARGGRGCPRQYHARNCPYTSRSAARGGARAAACACR